MVLIRVLMVSYAIGVTITFIWPISLYIVSGTRQLIVPIYFPSMSLESNVDYAVNLLYQIFVAPYGAVIYLHFDLLFVILLMHVNLMNDILCEKVRALNRIIATMRSSRMDISLKLRNLVFLQNELNGYA